VRILQIAQFYPPVPGGAELHVQSLARGLAQRGHEVDVVTLHEGDVPPEEVEDGIRIHRVRGWLGRLPGLHTPGIPRAAAPFPDPAVTAAIARVIRRHRPDVVHGHNWLAHSALPVLPGRDIPLVETLHNYGRVCAKQTLIRRGETCSGPGLTKCLACAGGHYGPPRGVATCCALWTLGPWHDSSVRHYIAVSESVAARNRLSESGRPFSVITNFVADALGNPQAAPPPLPAQLPDGEFILYVGALGRVKGVDVLFDAYRRLEAPPPLVVIGFRAPEMDELMASAPPGVIVHLDWPHAAVMEAWRRCAVGVCPSTWPEPCPTVVIEAMTAGVPLVGSRAGGIPELLDWGNAGRLVDAGDAGMLAAALGALIADPAERRRLGAVARQRSRDYLASAVVPRIEAVYRTVTDSQVGEHPS
jgi:glycosyltransferase involved in cell wall biosynthesis